VKLGLAEQQFQAGLFEEAVKTASEALTLDARNPRAYSVLALSHLELGKSATAAQVVQSARNMNIQSPALLYAEGVLLEQLGKQEEALKCFALARACDETNVDYFIANVECLVESGRPREAMMLLTEGVHRFDDRATVGLLAARVAAMLGETEQAAAWYRLALAERPDSAPLTEEFGVWSAQEGRFAEAVGLLLPLVQSREGAMTAPSVGTEPSILPSVSGDSGIRADRVSSVARKALAESLLQLHDDETAFQVLDDYARSQRDDDHAQLLMAKAALGAGNLAAAERAVMNAMRKRPRDPEVLLVSAAVHWKLGRLEAVEASLRKIIDDDPSDEDARKALNLVLTRRPSLSRPIVP